jgi:uncharacterized protein YjeT (DUF2065 family)
MPADFSALLDTLLVLAGLVLVTTGLVMFIYSKTSTQASSVEAFGIKLNVTHPSLILVLAGVGLMLAPRLLPEPAGRSDKAGPAVVAAVDKPQATEPAITSPPAAAPTLPPAPTSTVSTAAAPFTPPPAKPALTASATPPLMASSVRPIQPAKLPVAAATKPAGQTASSRPVITPAAEAAPAASEQTGAVAVPPAAAKPARPTLAYAALGLPISRSFWSGETRDGYTTRMHTALQQAGRQVLRMDVRGLELGQREFDAWWNESGQHPRSRELCAAPHAPDALLSARVETPVTISSVESAYWPELNLRLFVCASQRIYRQQKTLTPQNEDAWPFSIELNGEIERFLRNYRSDLTQ